MSLLTLALSVSTCEARALSAVARAVCSALIAAAFCPTWAVTVSMRCARAMSSVARADCSDHTPASTAVLPADHPASPASGGFICA